MRMWMTDAVMMCSKHRSGEHNEIHKHRPSFVKGRKMDGRVEGIVAIEPMSMKMRHDELAETLNHKSPYEQPDLTHYPDSIRLAVIDRDASRDLLTRRCPECAYLHAKATEGDRDAK